jgi:hypothetical protein
MTQRIDCLTRNSDQFQELAQSVDNVEKDPGLPDVKHHAVLSNSPDFAAGIRQGILEAGCSKDPERTWSDSSPIVLPWWRR